MPFSSGPNTINDSSIIFTFDTGDTANSYKGQPTTNQQSVLGTSGFGPSANNNVFYPVNGTGTFVRLGFGQTFGGYTIQPNDVVYRYDLGGYGCHYHGFDTSIPGGSYATFTFDYLVSNASGYIETNYLANFENALSSGIGAPNSLQDVWQTISFTAGPTGGGTLRALLYPGGCGGRLAASGFILFKNPQVTYTPYAVPFVQGTRSSTQGLLDLSGNNNTIDLVNMTYGANNSITFDGTDDYTDVTSNLGTLSQYTIEHVSFKGSENRMPISYRGGPVFYQYGDNSWYYTHGGVAGEYYYPKSFTINGWGHWTIVYNGSFVRIYRNGRYEGQQATSGTANWTNGMRIGNYTGLGYPWNGQIAVVKMYNRALMDSEVLQNYQAYKTRFNLQ